MTTLTTSYLPDCVEDNGFSRHVDAHGEGFSGEQHLNQPLRKQKLHHFFGDGQQISVVHCVAVEADRH